MKCTWLVVVALAASSTVARADEATARAHFDAGEKAYNLGSFPEAAELFRKAYEQWPEPAFLFNLAQTYRQIGDCKQAAFFYKRFLSLKEQDAKKPIKPELKVEVEKRIAELEECMKREIASKPPTTLDGGGGTTGGTQTATGGDVGGGDTGGGGDVGGGDDGGGDDGGVVVTSDRPKMIALRLGVGAGKLGAGDLPTKLQFATTLIAGYPLWFGDKIRLDVGAGFSFTPVPYTTAPPAGARPVKVNAKVMGIFANAGPTYMVTPKIGLRADVGVGVQVFSGLGMETNPFTLNGGAASGPLSSVLVRTALSADYAVTPNLVVTFTPIAFSYSPAPEGFDPEISSLTTVSVLAGISYQR